MIELIVDTSPFEVPNSKTRFNFVRIKCIVGFKMKDSSEYFLAEGIIDTGSYVTVIPSGGSEVIEKEVTGQYRMKGLNLRDECALPVDVGKTTCMLFDKFGNTSGNIEISSFFAKTNDVPVVLGFADILTKFKLHIDYPAKRAFLE